ncbi:MAG TPA: hypothetical protein VGL25_13110 [Casimicrobiaceae bacterium]
MLKLLVRAGKGPSSGIATVDSAEAFWRSLPSDDPIASQVAICDALAEINGPRAAEISRLRALFALEQRSQSLLEALLSEYVSPTNPSPDRERKVRRAVLDLTRSFAQAYELFLRHARRADDAAEWMTYAPAILVQLFKHREIDLLVALYRYEAWPAGRWKELNSTYEFALASGLARQPVPVSRQNGKTVKTITLEQMFVRILLLQLMDSGQLLPSDIAVARQWIARWSELPSLESVDVDDAIFSSSDVFTVDLAGSDGVKRLSSRNPTKGKYLRLDTARVAESIEHELTAVGNAVPASGSEAVVHARRLALLSKLKIVFAPKRPRIKRRGERVEVASMSVQAMIGDLPSLFRMLRNESRRAAEAVTSPSPDVDEITISDVSNYVGVRRSPSSDGSAGLLPMGAFDVPQPLWEVHDRSESGCRLRGRTLNARQSLPGSLMAFRANDAAWTVAIVRRFSKVGGDTVELGVEHIGRDPRRVVMRAHDNKAAPNAKWEKFVALYLPESDAYPRIPIKTLLVPAHEYNRGRLLTMLSTNETTIRLKEPIEQQGDFVWTSFDVVEPTRRQN